MTAVTKRQFFWILVALNAVSLVVLAAAGIFFLSSGARESLTKAGCQFLVVGHFYSLQPYPDLEELFVSQLSMQYPDADAIVFLGDNTIHGTDAEWEHYFSLIERLPFPAFFVPGNHDLRSPEGYERYLQLVGYTSKQAQVNTCRFWLLNTVNPQAVDFNDVEMVKGGGLDTASIELLTKLNQEPKPNDASDIIFVHHALFAFGLVHSQPTWNVELNRIYEHEVHWRTQIQPLIKGKAEAVFTGDLANAALSYQVIDDIPYYGVSFGSAFTPEPTSDRRPLTYALVEARPGQRVQVTIKMLEVPMTSPWYAFNRDAAYERFAADYDPDYDRQAYTYPN